MMIKTKGYSGSEIWIDASLVMSASRKDNGMSLVVMACGSASEE